MNTLAPAQMPSLPSQEAVMAQAGAENFTVASAILGRGIRDDLLAIYGFARLVDDVGDEAPGDRSALLDQVEAELDRVFAGERPEHPVMRRLAPTVAGRRLPDGPFRRLIEANRRDQSVTRYQTFEELLGYCDLSAAPVGELVLGVFGAATPARIALSDKICAALQILEHLQDIAEDLARGRVYMPREDLERFGCTEQDLVRRDSPARRALVAFEAARARQLLHEGAPLARTLALRPRISVAGFVGGGRGALDALGREAPARRWRAFLVGFLEAAIGR